MRGTAQNNPMAKSKNNFMQQINSVRNHTDITKHSVPAYPAQPCVRVTNANHEQRKIKRGDPDESNHIANAGDGFYLVSGKSSEPEKQNSGDPFQRPKVLFKSSL